MPTATSSCRRALRREIVGGIRRVAAGRRPLARGPTGPLLRVAAYRRRHVPDCRAAGAPGRGLGCRPRARPRRGLRPHGQRARRHTLHAQVVAEAGGGGNRLASATADVEGEPIQSAGPAPRTPKSRHRPSRVPRLPQPARTPRRQQAEIWLYPRGLRVRRELVCKVFDCCRAGGTGTEPSAAPIRPTPTAAADCRPSRPCAEPPGRSAAHGLRHPLVDPQRQVPEPVHVD